MRTNDLSVRGRGEGSRAYAQRTKKACRRCPSARRRRTPTRHCGAACRRAPPHRLRNCNPLPGRRSSPARDRPSSRCRPSSHGRPRASPLNRRCIACHASLRGLDNLCPRDEEAVCPGSRPRGRCRENRLGGRHHRPRHACGTEAGPVWVACRQHIHRRRVQALRSPCS